MHQAGDYFGRGKVYGKELMVTIVSSPSVRLRLKLTL